MQVTGNIELFDKGRGWRLASTYNVKGTLSGTNNTIWSAGSGYSAVVYDYTFALGKFKAGDATSITVLRGPREDKEVELQVTFPQKK